MDYFDQQAESFYDFLNENFKINKEKSWEGVIKNITILKVKLTYRYFAKLFPLGYKYSEELTKAQNDFTSIHYGTLKGNRIIDEVVRFSLYSDKIMVFHPLQNPTVTNQKIDPGRNPKYWLPDFLDALYFYTVIQKWVKAGIVKLIINPYQYDLKLRDEIDLKVRKRLENVDFDKIIEQNKEFVLDELAEQFSTVYFNKSRDKILEDVLSLESPRFNEEEAEHFTDKIINAIPRANPLYRKLNKDLMRGSMLTSIKGGGPLESLLFISEKSGGNIYTPDKNNWSQIQNYGLDDFWTKTNRMYSEVPLNFLNNVDTNFALELRKEGRLSGVRQEIKKIYKDLDGVKIGDLDNKKMKLIQEGFLEEIKKAESEWSLIRKQADNSRKQWITANVGVPIITNEISLLPLAVGSLAWLYLNENTTKEKLRNYRTKTPISVFVDLKNKEQSFFTELKNCIF